MMEAAEILRVVDHRPWELPSGPWVMMQGWYDLLFAHWALAPEILRPLIPEPLELQTFNGQAWVSVTPFDLRLQPRGLPPLFHFPEMNCRTYVEFGGKPGIFFFSLDARSRLAVWGARTFYRLPYFYADIRIHKTGGRIEYGSQRPNGSAGFKASYSPQGAVRRAAPGSLEHWLTERYCLYAIWRQRLYRGEIHHIPWPLQDATCEIETNRVAAKSGITLPEAAPLLQFARELDVLIWPLKPA